MTSRRSRILSAAVAWMVAAGGATASPSDLGFVEEQIPLPILGRVAVLRPDPLERTRGVVLFVSGDGGWRLRVVEMARRSASQALIVGLSMPAWRKRAERDRETCWYPAGELESIAQAVEKIYRLPRYLRPILVGYSSGATVVYGALAQGPPDAFVGAVSLGFCPDAAIARPFCGREDWKPTYLPDKRNSLLPPRPGLAARADGTARWTILQGQIDQVCDPGAVEKFAAQVPASRLIPVPKVGHGFSVARNWGEAFDQAIGSFLEARTAWEEAPEPPARRPDRTPEVVAQRLASLDLPLEIEWPEKAGAALIFVSGDGGWAELDQRVAAALKARGIAVVGWDSLRYFWEPKTPRQFAADLASVVEALPGDIAVFAGGYSFGAEVTPVALVETLGPRATSVTRLAGLVLLAPGPYASFEISPLDWIRSKEKPTKHAVRRAIEVTGGLPVLCLESTGAAGSGCPAKDVRDLSRQRLPGGHHFGGDFDGLAERILTFMRQVRMTAAPPRP